MNIQKTPRETGSWTITGRHVLNGFIIFFGTIFAMNGVLAYLAISTHTGLDTTNSYRRGLDYNDRIAAEKRQVALAWQPVLTLNPGADQLSLKLNDKAGSPVPSLAVKALLRRPATIEFDRKLVLQEAKPGRYTAIFAALAPGRWIVEIEAAWPGDDGDKIVYRLKKRLWLDPGKNTSKSYGAKSSGN